ncbi:MAG: autotransporter-associated beta strand repeat-containing protein [Kiritimatiellia bacterium]
MKWLRSSLTVLAVVFGGAASLVAGPKEYVWTGAQDAYWTNAANWTVGGAVPADVPGRYLTFGGEATNLDAVAVFDATGGDRTTVWLDGHLCVSSVVFRAGAPVYTLGEQNYGLYFALAHEGGRLVVEPGAHAPVISGVVTLVYSAGMAARVANTYDQPGEARYLNYADEPLVLRNFGNRGSGFPSGYATLGWYRYTGLGGTGDIRIESWQQNQSVVCLNYYPEGAGKVYLRGTTQNQWLTQFVRCHQVGGGRKAVVEVYQDELQISQSEAAKIAPLRVYGAGSELRFVASGDGRIGLRGFDKAAALGNTSYGEGYLRTAADVETGARLVFDCPLKSYTTIDYGTDKRLEADPRDGLYFHRGGGTMLLGGENSSAGGVDLASDTEGATLAFERTDALGSGPVRIGRAGCLAFVGAEDTVFDRDLVLTNRSLNVFYEAPATIAPTAVFRQAGAGALTVASTLDVVSGADAQAVLVLDNASSAPATWTGVLRDSADGLEQGRLQVVKTGAGTWTLSGENTHSGTTTVSGGTLALAAGGSIANSPVVINDGATLSLGGGQTIASLTCNGTAQLALAAGETFEVTALTQGSSGARLLVTLGDGARIRFPGLTELPDYLTAASPRGQAVPSSLDGEGYLIAATTTWQGADGASWAEAANWSDGVPTPDRLAVVSAADATVEVPAESATATAGAVWFEAGTLDVKGSLAVEVPKDGERFLVRPDATVRVSGGTLAFANADGVSGPALELDGGAVAVEAGTLDVSNSWGVVGTGKLSVAAGAQLAVMKDGATTGFGTGEATGEQALTLKPGCLYGKSAGYVVFGAAQSGKTSLTVEAPEAGSLQANIFAGSSPRSIKLGRERGFAEAKLVGGNLQPGNWGVQIAYGDSSAAAVTGRVHLAGGKITTASGYLDGSWSGLAVGLCTAAVPDPRSVRGEVWLEDGDIAVWQVSPLGLGVGGAEGFVRQTGGKLAMTSSAGVSVLGYGSGTGEYVLSNGTFTTSRPLYVGGCLRADLELKTGTSGSTILFSEGSHHPAGRQAAKGAFYALGGTLAVTAEQGIRVGVDGVGRFEVGPGATVTTTELVLSNACASTLAFTLGANGAAGALTATKLVIADGARLEIDATQLASAAQSTFRLAQCDEVAGAFAPEHVTVRAPAGQEQRFAAAKVVTGRNGQAGLWLKTPGAGLLLILR